MSSESSTGPRQERRARAAMRLAAEGLQLMARRGIAGCKVADIAAAAGVSKGGFFNHFASKEAFVASLVDGVLDDLARRVTPLGLGVSDPVTLLADLAGAHFRFFQLNPEAASLLQQALALAPGGEAHDRARDRLAKHLEMLAAKMAPAARALGWPEERTLDLALALFTLGSGQAWLGAALGFEEELPPELSERLGRALARGLGK